VLYRVDDSKLPTEEPVLIPDAIEGDVSPQRLRYGRASTTDATTGYVHDLLVVYTPAAKARYGQATLESMIQNAVQVANQAYQNSKVGITLNLVGLQEINYVETGDIVKTSLYDIKGTTDGKMDSVHKLRDTLGADIVSLISQDTNSCGIAWSMRVKARVCATGVQRGQVSCLSQHTLAHEIGHNQGNMHDRDSTSNTGAFPYSYGFRRCVSDGTGFRTVMSYSCTGAKRVAWFSNPNAYYNGYATGIAYESDPTKSADNARSMNNTADTVAAFRTAAAAGRRRRSRRRFRRRRRPDSHRELVERRDGLLEG
jgi:peptidyl-Asp metalloendopeptidase